MPPDLVIADDPTVIDYRAVQAIFEGVGWGDRGGAAYLRRAFCASQVSLFVCQKQGGDVLAFARALSDGVYYATIHDFIVAPAWQKRGIGSCLLKALLNRLAYIPTVFAPALPDSVEFYCRRGFVQRGYAVARFLNPEKERFFAELSKKTAP